MDSAINWHDHYMLTKDRILFTDNELHIPGIHVLAYQLLRDAGLPHQWHFHENSFEFTLATKGIFAYSTPSSYDEFSGEDIFIAFPNEIHGTNHNPVSRGELYWFQLDISDKNEFLFMNPQAAENLITQLKSMPHHIIRGKHTELPSLLCNAFHKAKDGESPQLIASYLQLFLYLAVSLSDK